MASEPILRAFELPVVQAQSLLGFKDLARLFGTYQAGSEFSDRDYDLCRLLPGLSLVARFSIPAIDECSVGDVTRGQRYRQP